MSSILYSMFDFHLHLARLNNPKQLKIELKKENYHYIAIACEPWEWEHLYKINPSSNDNINCYGIHPMIAQKISKKDFDNLLSYLNKDKNSLIGEAGLDKRFIGYEKEGIQEKLFLKQAEIALELKKDIQIHCVGDYMRIIDILKKAGYNKNTTKISRPIFHRFCGDKNVINKALEFDTIFSLHRDSFKKKNSKDTLKIIPICNIRFETDADELFKVKNSDTHYINEDYSIVNCVNALKNELIYIKKLYDFIK